jgi:hypothetical protein
VDDAAQYVERILHRYFEEKKVVLRTAEGLSFEQPRSKTIEREINSLFDQNRAGTSCWLADHQDRWLTIYPNRQAQFHDQGNHIYQLENITPEFALHLFNLLSEGQVETLQSEMNLIGSLPDSTVKGYAEDSLLKSE